MTTIPQKTNKQAPIINNTAFGVVGISYEERALLSSLFSLVYSRVQDNEHHVIIIDQRQLI